MDATSTNLKLDLLLASIEDEGLRLELFHQFHLVNPLEFAKLLHALVLPDKTKAQLLALKVGLSPAHQGVDLSPLIEKAIQALWARLTENARV